jgi:hypothetical protein
MEIPILFDYYVKQQQEHKNNKLKLKLVKNNKEKKIKLEQN